MRRMFGPIGLALVAALTFAACGGDDDDSSDADESESIFEDDDTASDDTATDETIEETTTTEAESTASIDPCSLVSKEEAEAVAGTALEDAVPAPEACSYTGPVTGPTAQFEVYVGPGAQKFLEIDRDELGHTFEEIPNVGDEAVIEEGTSFVRVGNTWVALRVVRLDDFSVYKQQLTDLTTTVAGRL